MQFLDERDLDAKPHFTGKFFYLLGSFFSMYKYSMLFVFTGAAMLVLAEIWTRVVDTSTERASTEFFGGAVFFVFELFATGGYQTGE